MNRLDKLPDGWAGEIEKVEKQGFTFFQTQLHMFLKALLASGKARIETHKGYSGDISTGPSYSRLIIELE